MKLSRLRLIVLLSLLIAVWVTIYGHGFDFPYVAQYDCSLYVTTQGEPLSYRTTTVSQSYFGKTCPEETMRNYRKRTLRIIPLVSDIGIWSTASFSVLAGLLWVFRNRLTDKRAGFLGVLFKAMTAGLALALLVRFLNPPQPGVVLGSLSTNIAGLFGFIAGFSVTYGILFFRWRDRLRKK